MTELWSFEITEEEVGRRVDNYLRFKLETSRNLLYSLIRVGKIRVNKKRVPVSYRLQLGDLITGQGVILKNGSLDTLPKQTKDNLINRIVYEDSRFLVLNKPPGMATHGGSGISFGVIELLRAQYPNLSLSLVHRLDRSTSGGLIVAKKNSALRILNELIAKRQIKKYYRVLVKGELPTPKVVINQPLLKNQLVSGDRIVTVDKAGKEATTIFKVLEVGKNCSLVEAELKTGRTHQIRVHAAYGGFPIVGDLKYGDQEFNQIARKRGYFRLYLHAYRLKWSFLDQNFDFIIPPEEQFLVF